MSAATNISLAAGRPSLDIIAVDELRAAAQRAFERDPAGAFSYGTSAGYPRLVAWIADEARRGAGSGDRHQRLDAGGRLPLPAAGRARATSWWSRRRATTARSWRCGTSAPTSSRSRSSRTGSTWARSSRRSRPARGRGSRTSSPTSRTRPAARCRSTSAGACSSWRPSTTSRSSRTTRTWSCASRARTSRRCCRSTSAAASSTRRRSRRRSARASAWATWWARADTIGAIRKIATSTYISPSMVAQAIVAEFCESGAIDGSIATVKAALRERRDATAGRARRATCPTPASSRPRAGTSSGSTCPRAPTWPPSRTPPPSAAWCS